MKFRKRREESLDDELRDYIERETEENIEAGMAPEEARYAALRKLGPVLWEREFASDRSVLGKKVFIYGGILFFRGLRLPTDLPMSFSVEMDRRALLFSLAVAVTSAVIFGLAPAFRSTRTDLANSLRSSKSSVRQSGEGGPMHGRTFWSCRRCFRLPFSPPTSPPDAPHASTPFAL